MGAHMHSFCVYIEFILMLTLTQKCRATNEQRALTIVSYYSANRKCKMGVENDLNFKNETNEKENNFKDKLLKRMMNILREKKAVISCENCDAN